MRNKYYIGNQEVIPLTDKWYDMDSLKDYIKVVLPGKEDYPFSIEYDALTKSDPMPEKGDIIKIKVREDHPFAPYIYQVYLNDDKAIALYSFRQDWKETIEKHEIEPVGYEEAINAIIKMDDVTKTSIG